jgi:GNAT superfamily N-acetyltransferase
VIPNLTRGGAPYALIENVVTDSAHRNRGYGKAILKDATEAAWRAGCYKVMLLTGSRRPAILKFYQDAGFEQNKTGFQIRRLPPRLVEQTPDQ